MRTFLILFALFISCVCLSQTKSISGNNSLQNEKLYSHAAFKEAKATPKANNLVQEFDSIVNWQFDTIYMKWKSKPSYKTVNYVYDANHNNIEYISKSNQNNAWVTFYKEGYIYDANNKLLEWATCQWNLSAWDSLYKRNYSYNINNDLVSEVRQSNGFAGWDYSSRLTYTYNASHKITCKRFDYWNGANWIGNNGEVFAFDNNDNMLLHAYQTCSNNVWNYTTRDTNFYDANNNLINTAQETYSNNVWNKEYKTIYSYNAANAISGFTNQAGNASNQWEDNRRGVITFSSNGDPFSELIEVWNGSNWINSIQITFTCSANRVATALAKSWDGSAWVNFYKDTYTYNSTGKILNYTSQLWLNGWWQNNYRGLWTFDANDNETSYSPQIWKPSGWRHYYDYTANTYDANNFRSNFVRKQYKPDGGPIEYGDSIIYYYKTFVGLKEDNFKLSQFNISPNPNNGQFTLNTKVNLGDIEVYDLLGALVFQGNISGLKTTLNLSTLPKGIYIMVVSQGKTRQNLKFVIE